jgi:hypothetical protein
MAFYGKLIAFMFERSRGWIRFPAGGVGIRYATELPPFSERAGIVKPFIIIGRYRWFWLEPLAKAACHG